VFCVVVVVVVVVIVVVVVVVLCRYRPFDGPVKEFEESYQTYEADLWFKNLNKSVKAEERVCF
jgi:hypothetical protein